MNAMQKPEGTEDTSLKVPKLKLKLSMPFQNPIESEQSSTESDSDSDNDEDENVSHEQENSLNEINEPIQKELEHQPFSHQEIENQPYSYDGDNSLLKTGNNNNNYEDGANESGSSTKNTSVDSDEKSICVEDNADYQPSQQQLLPPLQDELNNTSHIQITQPNLSIQEQTSNLDQTNMAEDTSIMTTINVN